MIELVGNQYDELSYLKKSVVSIIVSSHAKSLLGVLTSIVGSTPHAAPIVLPIVVTGFLAKKNFRGVQAIVCLPRYAMLNGKILGHSGYNVSWRTSLTSRLLCK